jgi:drug/metabolite transporter (DMT)-like permease
MVLATVLWGATFVVIRDSVRSLDPVALVFARNAAASAVFGIALLIARPRGGRGALIGGTLAGLAAAAGFAFQAIGLTRTSAGTSAFLTCAGSLFAGFLAWPLLRQPPTRPVVAGIVLALAGAAILTLRDGLSLGAGDLWTLLGSLVFALQIVLLARFAPSAHPLRLAAAQAVAAAIVLSPSAGTASRQLATLAPEDGWRLAYLVLAGSVLAPLLHVYAQRTLSAGRVGVLLALEPVFALFFAITVGEERFGVRWWLGCALILSGVMVVEAPALRAEAASRRASE